MQRQMFTILLALCTLLVLPATLLLAARTSAPPALPTHAYAPPSNSAHLADEVTIEWVGSVDTPGTANDIAIVGDYAYVADRESGLQVIDISTPITPTIVGSLDFPETALSIEVFGDYAYVPSYKNRLQIIDIHNPTTPTIVGKITIGLGYDIAIAGAFAYLADGDVGLRVIDIYTPFAPSTVGIFRTSSIANGVAISENYAYVATNYAGLQIIDISVSANPRLVGSVDTSNDPLGVDIGVGISDTYAYLTNTERGLQVIDISNPTAPTIVGSVNTPGVAQRVAIEGNYAYVADGDSGLQVIDISNPANPTIVAEFVTLGNAMDIALLGNYVYLACNDGGLQIFRVSGKGTETSTPTPTNVSVGDTPTPMPTGTAPSMATDTPIPTPTAIPSPTPTAIPSPTPTDTPIPTPTAIPSPTPIPTPTPTPTPQPDDYEPDNTCANAGTILSDGTIQQHTFTTATDVDWVQFDATKDETYLIEAYAPTHSQADVILQVYTSCDNTYGSYDPTFSSGVKMQLIAPATGPIFLRMVNQNPDVYGEDVAYNVSVRRLTSGDTGALILVAGRLKTNDGLQPNIHTVTENVYNVFKNDGRYTDEHINYLATDLSIEGVDSLATKDNLQTAITSWAAERVDQDHPLTLYMMDHGSKTDGFYLDEPRGERVSPDELALWLNTLPDEVQVNVIIEACYSGVFVEALAKPGRVVITSTSANNIAHASAAGATFSDHFLTQLRQGSSLYTAFQTGHDAVMAAQYGLPQVPWIEDNGNGTTNEPDDGMVAQQRGFSMGTLSGDVEPDGFAWHPYIVEVEKPESIVDERGTIRAQVRDDGEVRRVWAVVYEPSYTPPTAQNEMVSETDALPAFVLNKQNDEWYGAEYTQFDEPGTYRVVVYAEDDAGMVAPPVAVEVTVGGDERRVYLPLVRR